MSFLFPAFLAGAAAVVVPIVLHLLRRDAAVRQPFSDTRLLRRMPAARRRRLRDRLLLALRVAALLLLALAFARPYLLADGDVSRGVTIVALDRSFSMGAPGRFPQARALAVAHLRDAPSGHAVGLVAFDESAEVRSPVTPDRARAAAAVAGVSPGATATRFTVGLGAAATLADGRPGRVVVVTDRQASGWRSGWGFRMPRGLEVEVVAVPPVGRNLAVAAVEPSPTGVLVRILNTGPPRESRVTLVVDGAVTSQRSVVLRERYTDVPFEVTLPDVGVVAATVDDGEGFAADDRRYALLDPRVGPPVGIVTSRRDAAEAFYLERALDAGGPEGAPRTEWITPDRLDQVDGVGVLVVLSTEGLDRRGRGQIATFARRGGGVLVVAGPALETRVAADLTGVDTPLRLAPATDRPDRRLVVTEPRHPVFLPFGTRLDGLSQVRVWAAVGLEADDGRVLARFDDGAPALVEHVRGAGRVLVLATDVSGAWNDFPRHPTFVPFVHEAVRYLAGGPPPAPEVTVGDLALAQATSPGFHVLPGSGRRLVVNVDLGESEPEADDAAAFLRRIVRDDAAGGVATAGWIDDAGRREYWWYVLLAMAVVLVIESLVARRGSS